MPQLAPLIYLSLGGQFEADGKGSICPIIPVRDELSKNLVIHKNVKQDIIITTEDKIKLVLINTRKILISQRDWWTPLGLVTSLVTTICTADFKETLGFNKDHWQAVFVMMSIFSAGWLINTL